MKRLRLALITRRFWPLVGGAEAVMAMLGTELRRSGHDVTIVTARWEPDWPVELVHREVPVVRLANPRQRGWGTLRYMSALKSWLRDHQDQLDLAYVSMLKHDAYVAVKTYREARCPVAVRAEGAGPTGDCHWQQTARFGRRIARMCRTADAIVAPSRAIEAELHEAEYPTQHVHFIPNGVALPPARGSDVCRPSRGALSEANWDLLVPEDAPLGLFTGRLHEAKGLTDLVAAWRLVVNVHPEARLWLVGDGPLRDSLYQQIGDLELRRHVILPGVFDDVSEVLLAADFFVLPSYEEGMSIALLEAMAAELPCIASDIPGNRQLIEHQQQGFLVPPRNPEALADAILAVIANPLQSRKYAAAARQRVVEEFSVGRMVEKHLELFENLIAARGT